MKKLFIALAAVTLTACVKAPEKTVKVYAWQGEGENTTEQTLQADFSKWHAHGVDGMCYNAGHDTEKIQRAAKAIKSFFISRKRIKSGSSYDRHKRYLHGLR